MDSYVLAVRSVDSKLKITLCRRMTNAPVSWLGWPRASISKTPPFPIWDSEYFFSWRNRGTLRATADHVSIDGRKKWKDGGYIISGRDSGLSLYSGLIGRPFSIRRQIGLSWARANGFEAYEQMDALILHRKVAKGFTTSCWASPVHVEITLKLQAQDSVKAGWRDQYPSVATRRAVAFGMGLVSLVAG